MVPTVGDSGTRGEAESGVINELMHQFIGAPAADLPMGWIHSGFTKPRKRRGDVLCLPDACDLSNLMWAARQGSVVCIEWHCGHRVLRHPHILEGRWYA